MKTFILSIRFLVVLTVLTGVLYPLAVTGIGQLFFKNETRGSLIFSGKDIIGSELIAQGFANPKYFWPRPSAAKYDGGSSGASNQSVNSAELLKTVREREAAGLVREGRFASASGLDPHISPEAAVAQVSRITKARALDANQSQRLLSLTRRFVQERQFGVLGEPRVNVLLLNLALDGEFR